MREGFDVYHENYIVGLRFRHLQVGEQARYQARFTAPQRSKESAKSRSDMYQRWMGNPKGAKAKRRRKEDNE